MAGSGKGTPPGDSPDGEVPDVPCDTPAYADGALVEGLYVPDGPWPYAP